MSTLAICSGKGSPGATFVATNLVAAMGRNGMDVLLLDVDPAGGDTCCYLGLDPRKGLYPLRRMEGIPTEPDRLLAEAEERSDFLAICGFPEASELASPETLMAVLRTAKQSGRTVVADIGRVSEANAALAAEADLVIVVVRPDLVSVLGAQRAVRCLEAGTVARERLAAVICGLERGRPADRAEVADALGLSVLGAVPLDRRGARKALLAQAPGRNTVLARIPRVARPTSHQKSRSRRFGVKAAVPGSFPRIGAAAGSAAFRERYLLTRQTSPASMR